MRHLVISAITMAGVLATINPVLADPVAASTPGLAQIAAPAAEKSPLQAPAGSSPSDAPTPEAAAVGKGVVPVGFGWG